MVYILGQHGIVHTSQYRIYAEGGYVCFEDKKTGAHKALRPQLAMARIQAALVDLAKGCRDRRDLSNNGVELVAQDRDLPDKLAAVVRHAMHQRAELDLLANPVPAPAELVSVEEVPKKTTLIVPEGI